ncbi:MAG: hypothetical protein U0172_00630 [Nitrospiraceae bacterium]
MASSRLSILLVCDDHQSHANTILDHIDAFSTYSRHEVHRLNPRGRTEFSPLRLDQFDVVVIHYSLCVLYESYLPSSLKSQLRAFSGLKIQFIQDDYRWVDKICAVMRDIGLDVLYTLVPEKQIGRIWTSARLPNVLKVTTLAGYVPDRLLGLQTPQVEQRPLDIGYRGRELPYWLGRLSQEKVWIGQGVLARSADLGLACDIGWREEQRVYGTSWDEFLSSCKATLGTESGATITDFDGSIEAAVSSYLSQYPSATYEEVHKEILHKYEGNVLMNVISPKIFESIALRTALILYRGEYSGVLSPWKHYIPLEKDFSNLGEVAETLKDMDFVRRLTTCAYDEIIASEKYSYRTFIAQFDQLIESWPKAGCRPMEGGGATSVRIPALGTARGRRVRLLLARRPRLAGFSPVCVVDGKLRLQIPPRALELCTRVGKRAAELLAGPVGEGLLALRACMESSLLRRLFLRRVVQFVQRNDGIRLKNLLKEILLWRAMEIAVMRGPSERYPFSVCAEMDLEKSTLVLTSVPVDVTKKDGVGFPSFHAQKDEICHALSAGLLRNVRWDHSRVSLYVTCRVAPLVCIGVGVGLSGLREFTSLFGRE